MPGMGKHIGHDFACPFGNKTKIRPRLKAACEDIIWLVISHRISTALYRKNLSKICDLRRTDPEFRHFLSEPAQLPARSKSGCHLRQHA